MYVKTFFTQVSRHITCTHFFQQANHLLSGKGIQKCLTCIESASQETSELATWEGRLEPRETLTVTLDSYSSTHGNSDVMMSGFGLKAKT